MQLLDRPERSQPGPHALHQLDRVPGPLDRCHRREALLDRPGVVGLAGSPAGCRPGDQRFQPRPLRIPQIARISFTFPPINPARSNGTLRIYA